MSLLNFMDESSEMFAEAEGSKEVDRMTRKVDANPDKYKGREVDNHMKKNNPRGYRDYAGASMELIKSAKTKDENHIKNTYDRIRDNKNVQDALSAEDAYDRHKRRHLDRKLKECFTDFDDDYLMEARGEDYVKFNGNMRTASDFENKKTIERINKSMANGDDKERLTNKLQNGAVKSTKWSDYKNYSAKDDAKDRHDRRHKNEGAINFI